MIDYNQHLANIERMKDLRRNAENERLARSVAKNDSDLLNAARNVLGRSLVRIGQQLLKDKQR
jgi:hypothetical protein